MELGGDSRGLVGEVAPGDADDAPAGGLEGSVAGAVVVERVAGGVACVAVELDDEARGAPQAVGLDPSVGELQGGVDLGPREAGVVDEREEAVLELAARHGGADAPVGEDLA